MTPKTLNDTSRAFGKSGAVLVIILHYGKISDTRECLRSLCGVNYQPFSVLVIDNGTGSAESAHLCAEFSDVEVVTLDESVGFAAANNVGLELSLSRGFCYSLLLNNDTIVDPDLLSILCGAMQNDCRIAMAGPLMFFYSDRNAVWACGGTIDRFRIQIDGNRELAGIGNSPADTDYLPGACVLIRNAVLRETQLMPEQYYLGFEEAEFCLAAKRIGYRIVVCREAVLYHKVGMSSERVPKYRYNHLRSRFLFARCLHGRLLGGIFTFAICVSYLLRYPKDAALLRAALRDHLRYKAVKREHLSDFEVGSASLSSSGSNSTSVARDE